MLKKSSQLKRWQRRNDSIPRSTNQLLYCSVTASARYIICLVVPREPESLRRPSLPCVEEEVHSSHAGT